MPNVRELAKRGLSLANKRLKIVSTPPRPELQAGIDSFVQEVSSQPGHRAYMWHDQDESHARVRILTEDGSHKLVERSYRLIYKEGEVKRVHEGNFEVDYHDWSGGFIGKRLIPRELPPTQF